MGDIPRIELFARHSHDGIITQVGWDFWGDESEELKKKYQQNKLGVL